MIQHLPVLQVVLPLVAAPLCLVLRRASLVRLFTLGVAWICLAIAVSLLRQVLGAGPISYELGGWPPPIGVEYRVDVANAFVLMVVSAIASVVLMTGPGQRGHAIPSGREHLFYATFLLCLAGLLGVTITGDDKPWKRYLWRRRS